MPRSRTRYDLLRKRLKRFTRLLHGLEAGDVQAVHQVRVASRRLREILPLLGLEAGVAVKLGRRLRRVTRRLGPVRELDVLLQTIDQLAEGPHDRALGRVQAAVRDDRRASGERLAGSLPADDLRRLARRLERAGKAIARQESSDRSTKARGWRWALEARLSRRGGALARAIRDAGAVYLPERLHTVRIAVKKLRYAVELRDESAALGRTLEQTTLRRAQEQLGRLHDLQVLLDRVRQIQASLTPPDLTLWRELDVLVGSIEDECRRRHARYMRLRPELLAMADRLSASPSPATRRAAEPRAGAR